MTCLPLKICGITRARDAELCASVRAAYAGFIFVEKSPRCVSPKQVAAFDTGKVARVGVFANATPDKVRQVMREARLDFAQLHGGEGVNFCRTVGPERVIKVLWPQAMMPRQATPIATTQGSHAAKDGESNSETTLCGEAVSTPKQQLRRDITPAGKGDFMDLLEHECERFAPVCSFFLLDAGQRGGGSGRSLPFEAFRSFKPPRPWLLAGGLSPYNLADAVAACTPHAFDCNSGLEEAPGRKNQDLVEQAAAILLAAYP